MKVAARLLLAVLLVLLAGCGGLPTPRGVRPATDVEAAAPEPERIRVLLPGPKPDASATEVVAGFLDAQRSPDGKHAAARQFLARGTTWDDAAGAVIYAAGTESVQADPRVQNGFTVSLDTVGQILPTGAYRLDAVRDARLRERGYVVVREPASGELRLTQVPAGVRISQADLDRSFAAVNVYFLARDDEGGITDRLVADRVFLPVTAPPAQAAVARLLAGPSDALEGAVDTAVPSQTRLLSLRVEDGVVAIDLSAGVRSLPGPARRRLAAQLVWTLTPLSTLTGIRLLVEGRPLDVPGTGPVQTDADRLVPPPDRLDDAPLLYVQDRRLHSLDSELPDADVTNGALPIDVGRKNPSDARLAVLTHAEKGRDVVRIGTPGTVLAQVFSRSRISSLSWGSGTRGLWVLEPGRSPLVWLLPADGADPEAKPESVPYQHPAGAGDLTQLQVSRDGTRAALVFGAGRDRRLFVGTVVPGPSGPRLDKVAPVAQELTNVTDVAWQTGTRLAVLAAPPSGEAIVPLIVAVDGSAVTVFPRPGPDEALLEIAAAPGRPLAVLTTAGELFRDDGEIFVPRPQGKVAAPAYPG